MNLFYSDSIAEPLNLNVDLNSKRDVMKLSCRIQSDLQDTELGHRVKLCISEHDQSKLPLLAYKLKVDIMDCSLYRHIADVDTDLAKRSKVQSCYFDIQYREDSGIEMKINLVDRTIEFIRVEIPESALLENHKMCAEISMEIL